MNNWKRLPVLAVAVLALAFTAPSKAETFKMKIGTIGMNDIQHEFLKAYKERLEEATNGNIEVSLFPGAQLGSIADTVKGLQFGTVEMFVVPPGFLQGIDPRFSVASSPGLFTDIAHAHRAFTDPAFREEFLKVGVDKGVRGVSIWNSGPSDYATMEPIRTLADFEGKKIRVLATEVEIAIMKEFGATGIPMDMVDVLPALQRGALDGIRSVASIMDARKFWTTTKFITVVNDSHFPVVAFVSTKFYDKLPPEYQQALERIGRELEPLMLERLTAITAAAYDSWRENGAEVIELPPGQREEFIERVTPIADKHIGSDPQLGDIYSTLKAAAARHEAK